MMAKNNWIYEEGYLLAINRRKKNGINFLDKDSIFVHKTNLGFYCVKIKFFKGNEEVIIKKVPCKLFSKEVNEFYNKKFFKNLFVKVLSNKLTYSIGWDYNLKNDNSAPRTSEFFFRKDTPSRYESDSFELSKWPNHKDPILNKNLFNYFQELESSDSRFSKSLERCLSYFS